MGYFPKTRIDNGFFRFRMILNIIFVICSDINSQVAIGKYLRTSVMPNRYFIAIITTCDNLGDKSYNFLESFPFRNTNCLRLAMS